MNEASVVLADSGPLLAPNIAGLRIHMHKKGFLSASGADKEGAYGSSKASARPENLLRNYGRR